MLPSHRPGPDADAIIVGASKCRRTMQAGAGQGLILLGLIMSGTISLLLWALRGLLPGILFMLS